MTFTAKVAPQTGSTVPTGTVAFLNGTTILGTATLNSGGTATFSTTALPPARDPITASYEGSTTNSSSVSAAVTVTVTQTLVATTTSLTASATQIDTGQSVTFTATVSPTSGSTTPTGTVTFLDGATSLGTGTLNSGGMAFFSTTTLSAGQPIDHGVLRRKHHQFRLGLLAGHDHGEPDRDCDQYVADLFGDGHQHRTERDLHREGYPANREHVPTGTVAFLNGTTIIGTATAELRAAWRRLVQHPCRPDLIRSPRPMKEAAPIPAPCPQRLSVTVTQTVVATTTSLTASATQIDTGQSVTFTAIVSPTSGSTTPTGTVTFLDGATSLGTATLNSGGMAFFSTTLSRREPIDHGVLRRKHHQFRSVSSPVTITVSQTRDCDQYVLTSSATAINTGQSVTFTAKVAPQTGSAVPTGTVAFLDGSSIIGIGTLNASGIATFSTASLPREHSRLSRLIKAAPAIPALPQPQLSSQ